MLYELLESLGCDPIEAYPDESIGDLCERFNEAKGRWQAFRLCDLRYFESRHPRFVGRTHQTGWSESQGDHG